MSKSTRQPIPRWLAAVQRQKARARKHCRLTPQLEEAILQVARERPVFSGVDVVRKLPHLTLAEAEVCCERLAARNVLETLNPIRAKDGFWPGEYRLKPPAPAA